MAGAARILSIRVPAIDTTTAFQIQFAQSGVFTWTGFDPTDPTPSAAADILVAELDANSDYTLDGLNAPAGNDEAASLEGTWYQVRLKSGSLYGMWSAPFRVGPPTAWDLSLFLTAMGLDAGTLDLQGAVTGALDAFQTATGRVMLAVSGVRLFDPPTNPSAALDLGEDLTGTPSELTVGGTALVFGSGYRLLEPNAAARGKPYWAVQFGAPRLFGASNYPYWNSISITGYWGYGLTIPNDAWAAILALAAIAVAPQLSIIIAGGLVKWTEADVTEDYGAKPYSEQIALWDGFAKRTIAQYRRVQVGIGG